MRETIDVRGRVRTELGAELPMLGISLRQHGDAARRRNVTHQPAGGSCGFGVDTWLELGEDERGRFGRFVLERLPKSPLEVLLLDAPDRPGYGFEVRDAEGQLQPRYTVHTRALDGGLALHPLAANGRAIARGDPLARRLKWCVAWRGMRPVHGDPRDFIDADNGLALAHVALEPGWGTRILARDAGGQPLAGVEVELDGESAGRTDAQGRLDLYRDEPPDRIDFACTAWRLLEGVRVPAMSGTREAAWHEPVFAPPR